MEAKRTVGGHGRHRWTDPFQKAALSGYDASFWPLGATMRRRDFITLFGGAAAVWPLGARAQQGERIRRVGVLLGGAENDVAAQTPFAAFRASLPKLGWTEGRNIELDIRWVGAIDEHRLVYAAEIVSRAPDVIFASGAPEAIALQQATAKIPIVFASGSDPVRNGLVTNLARPEGNITGFPAYVPSLSGKWLELLKAFVPHATRVAIVAAPENPIRAEYLSAVQSAAQERTVETTIIELRDDVQIKRDIDVFARAAESALLVLPGASTIVHRDAIVAAAALHRLPAVYPFRYFAASGGLMSYGVDTSDLFRRAATYVDRILRGERPGNLPVQLPTKFELVINLNTAKTLGLTVPPALLATADEVIE
jgi:putative ABC transport system substrate-binding protein